MKFSLKLLLQFCSFNLFFAAFWAISIPQDVDNNKGTPALSYRAKLCSETPSLNISEVCLSPRETSNTSASVLTDRFSNVCDHAIYLVQKLCGIILLDSNLTNKTNVEVTSILNSKELDTDESFCESMLNDRTKLGYGVGIGKRDFCVKSCLIGESNGFLEIKSLCKFIQWLWNFIKDHVKDKEASKNVDSSTTSITVQEEIKMQVKDEKSNGSKVMSTVQQPLPGGSIIQTAGQLVGPSTVDVVKNVNQEPAAQGESPIADPGNVKEDEARPDGGNPNLGKKPMSSTQTNQSTIEKEKPQDAASPQVPKSGLSSKSPTPSTLEEEDGNNPINPVEDRGVNTEDVEPDQNVKVWNPQNEMSNAQAKPPMKSPSSDMKGSQNSVKKQKTGYFDKDENINHFNGDDDDEPRDDSEDGQAPRETEPDIAQSRSYLDIIGDGNETENSHFFVFFFIATFICIVFYLIYQNKRKIIAMALEGKKARHNNRRRPTSASYQKLDNKLDEVMASSPPPSKTHVIY